MQGNIKILLLLIFLLPGGKLLCQVVEAKTQFSLLDSLSVVHFPSVYGNVLPLDGSFNNHKPNFRLSSDQVVKNFAFFCKAEWKFEKKTALPLKFRLGSLQQTDFLEGKINSRRY